MQGVNMSDPQDWNRYAYVSNDPLGSFDPLGFRRQRRIHGHSHALATNGCGGSSDPGLGSGGLGGCGSEFTVNGVQVSGQFALGVLAGSGISGNGTYQIWTSGGCVSATDSSGQGTGTTCVDGGSSTFQYGNSGAMSWTTSFLGSLVTDFPSNFEPGSCFMQFLSNSIKNFVGLPGIDTVAGTASAHYGFSQLTARAIPNTRVARGGISPRQWLQVDEAGRLSNSAKFGLWFNADVAMGNALFQKEIPAAFSSGGKCH
jgi:hypothetical protein